MMNTLNADDLNLTDEQYQKLTLLLGKWATFYMDVPFHLWLLDEKEE